MITVDDLISELRSWVGTPVIAAGAVKGKGCNCLGMAGGAAKELGLVALWQAFEPYQGQPIPPKKRFLIRALSRHLEEIPRDSIERGCLLLLRENQDDATHVALVTRKTDKSITVIEATGAKVSEHRLDNRRLIIAAFRVPGVSYE